MEPLGTGAIRTLTVRCSLEDDQSHTEGGLRREKEAGSKGGDSQQTGYKQREGEERGIRECCHRNVSPDCWRQQRL